MAEVRVKELRGEGGGAQAIHAYPKISALHAREGGGAAEVCAIGDSDGRAVSRT